MIVLVNDKKRIYYLVVFVFLLIIEVIIALFVHDKIIRPYMGDVLVVVLLYCFIRVFVPNKFKLMPLFIFIFAALVEGLQYLNLVELLGLQNNSFAKILVGSVFDWRDIACYAIGCILVQIYELRNLKKI